MENEERVFRVEFHKMIPHSALPLVLVHFKRSMKMCRLSTPKKTISSFFILLSFHSHVKYPPACYSWSVLVGTADMILIRYNSNCRILRNVILTRSQGEGPRSIR